ncbi:MAG: DNA polymerase III subunit delta [Clostridium sp.]|nr:DNA polymerase III subunit delta [Clostridium sp.]
MAATYDELRRQIISGDLKPAYILHGEEGYFIDELLKLFEEALPEEDREFNLHILYATDTPVQSVISRCQGFPMMSDRVLVIVREAQGWGAKEYGIIAQYLAHPLLSTTLVVASRGKTVKNKELSKVLQGIRGEEFESKPLREAGAGPLVAKLLKERGLNIEPKGLAMLCENVGTDLSRLYNQVEKLAVVLQRGAMVTPEVIERNIGVSKDYNSFELRDAVLERNKQKAIRIAEHFRTDPKNNPAIVVVAGLFSAFSDLTVYHFLRDKSPSAVMGALKYKSNFQVQKVERAARSYTARQSIEIITLLRDADRKMKGVGSRQNPYDILRDLLFAIFNCRGI